MRRFVALGILVLFCSAVQAGGQTVLVVSFFNLSDSSSLDWIGESISESIRETLASEGVLVLDRDSREEAYRRLSLRPYARLTRASVIKLGEALDAERVVYGEFRVAPAGDGSSPSGGLLQITARILDLTRMKQEPELTASGPLEELTTIQNHLSWQTLLRFIKPREAPSEEQIRNRRRPVRLDALENYIRGLLASMPDQKHRFFTQAVRLDPDFSQPCFELGRMHWNSKNYRIAAGWLERVTPDNPRYYEANFLLGLCRYHTAEYEKAQTAFELVVKAVPLNEVWNNLGAAQSRRNLPEALDSFQKALDGDPNDPAYLFNLGYALWKQGDYEEAADSFRTVLDRTPDDAVAASMLGRCLKKAGPRPAETRVQALERLKHDYNEMAYRQLQVLLTPDDE